MPADRTSNNMIAEWLAAILEIKLLSAITPELIAG
jgi:hypothetical protein